MPNPWTAKISRERRERRARCVGRVTPESHGKITYLLTLGFKKRKRADGCWVITDRFGNVIEEELYYESKRICQQRLDLLNEAADRERKKEGLL